MPWPGRHVAELHSPSPRLPTSRSGPVHVATTKRTYKGKAYQTHLLRRTFRKDGKVQHETLGNLSHLPDDLIEVIRQRLRGELPPSGPWKIVRSLPHGHVALILGTIKALGFDNLIASRRCRQRDLVLAMIVSPELFDEKNLAEITSPDFPGERLIVCRNPLLAAERERKRAELLALTENELGKIARATRRPKKPLRGKDQIGLLRVGWVQNKHKMAKHFILQIEEDSFSYRRDKEKSAAEAALDGIYVVRTSLPAEEVEAQETVRAYKNLSRVERAFRSLKTVDLKIRPIYHWQDERIRAHVFLCMLAYYVEWHLRGKLAPVLFDDEEREAVESERSCVVERAPRSATARAKEASKRTEDDHPVHSFQSLLEDLATLSRNQVQVDGSEDHLVTIKTEPTPFQQHVFDLAELTP